MASSTTMTIQVRPEVKEKLDRIAAETQRSQSFLAGEAVAAFVDRELAIIEAVKRGLADAEAGRIVPLNKPWWKSTPSSRRPKRNEPARREAPGFMVARSLG